MAPLKIPARRSRFRRRLLAFAAIVLALSSLPIASSQDKPAPSDNVTAKWLAEQDPQWQTAFQREVKDAFDKALADLNKQYLANIEKQFTQATRDGKLDEAVALRTERDRATAAGAGPLAEDLNLPPAVETLRASYRKSLAALEADRTDRAKKLFARYDAILAQNLTALTQRQRLDEALLIKAKREELSASWLQGAAAPPSAPATTTTPPPASVTPPTPPTPATTQTPPPTALKPATGSPKALVEKLLAAGATVRAPKPLKSADELTSDDPVIESVGFGKNVSDQVLAAVIALKVETISLRGEMAAKLSLDDWQQFAQSRILKKLDLVGAPKAGVFSRLAKIQTLEEINFGLENGPAHKDSDIAALGALPKLTFLRMTKTPMNGSAFAKWPANGPLKTLLVPQSANFDEANLQALLTAAPHLSELSVGTFSVSDAKIKILEQFTALRKLRVSKDTPPAAFKKLQDALPKAKAELRTDERF